MSLRSFKLNAVALTIFLVLTFLLQTSVSLVAQDCDAKEFANIPGKWNGPGKGSIENVSQANLIKEREVLAKIHEMMKKSYSPTGGDLSFSNVFGYNKYTGKNWLADPYEYSMYFLDYICKRDYPNSHNYKPNAETGHTVYFSVNEIWSQNGYFKLYATELPDDHYDGYLSFTKWPEEKNGYLFWPLLEPEERYPQKEYQYLITYDGKLPFIPFTKGEYLVLKIPLLQKAYEEGKESLKSIDTTDAYGKRTFDEAQEFVKEKEKLLNETIELQKTLSAEELAQPAIIDAGESKSQFRGFKSETDRNINHLVKPNPDYYDTNLPKWVPQFICVTIHTDIKEETGFVNIQNIEKGIDFANLKSLLGKTQIE